MACGPSCTDCPACRGEIPHDAPAMHDLAWGMMHAEGAGSARWALAIVHNAVRDGVVARGAEVAADRRIREFLQETHAGADQWPAVLMHADDTAPPWPGPPIDPFDPRSPPTGGRFRTPPPRPEGDPHDPTPPPIAPYVPTKGELERIRRPSRDLERGGETYSPKVLGAKCCPKRLDYPKTIRRGEPWPMRSVGLMLIEMAFEFEAEFNPPSPDEPLCDCKCCFFRQWVFKSDPNSTSEPPGKPERHGGEPPGEDLCTWIVMTPTGKDTGPQYDSKYVYRKRGDPPAPPKDGHVLGPFCYGDHYKQPIGPQVRLPREPREYWPSDPRDPRTEACLYKNADFPKVSIYMPGAFHWQWESWGVIYDRCHDDVPLRAARLTWDDAGKVSPDGKVTYDETKVPHESRPVKLS